MKPRDTLFNVWGKCGGKPIFPLKKSVRMNAWEKRIVREYWGMRK